MLSLLCAPWHAVMAPHHHILKISSQTCLHHVLPGQEQSESMALSRQGCCPVSLIPPAIAHSICAAPYSSTGESFHYFQ